MRFKNVFTNDLASKSRVQLSAWFQLIKLGDKPFDALERVGIKDLESIIAAGQFNLVESESESDSVVENSKTSSEEIADHVKELLEDILEGINEETDQSFQDKDSSASGQEENAGDSDADGRKVSNKEDGSKQEKVITIDISFEEDVENVLVELVDWLLSEAEYCAHTLLMADGKVLITSTGEVEKKFFWVPDEHECLTEADSPTEAAEQRLKNALEALRCITDCSSMRSLNLPWKARYQVVVDMLSALNNDIVNELLPQDEEPAGIQATSAVIKPFYEVITDSAGSHDLYLLKNGLPGYLEALTRLLAQTTGLHWNLNILNSLTEASSLICDVEQVLPMVENLAAAKKITDIRVSRSYVKFFRSAFENLGFDDKKRVMAVFYEKHGTPVPPAWHENDEEFATNLTTAIVGLCARKDREKSSRKLAEEFSWWFMLSIKFTWWRLLLPTHERGQAALNHPDIIPIMTDILRYLPPVVGLRANGERVILGGVRSLVKENQITNEELEHNWIRIVRSLFSEKKSVTKKDDNYVSGMCSPVIDKTEGLATVILPVLAVHNPRLGLRALVDILDSGSGSSVKWSGEAPTTDASDKWNEHSINAAKLLSTVIETSISSKKRQVADWPVLSKLCSDSVPLLIAEWKRAGLVLAAEALEWIERRFETSSMPQRIWLFSNLRRLPGETIRVPVSACLFDVFQLPEEKYKKVDCELWEDHKTTPCAFKALFQLISFSSEAVQDILKEAKFDYLVDRVKNGQLSDHMTEALVAVLKDYDTLNEWRGCIEIVTSVFDLLRDKNGPSIEEDVGLLMVAPAVKLCEAVTRLVKQAPHASTAYFRNFAELCSDIVVERVVPLNDPSSKYVAWNKLFAYCCKLIRAWGRKPMQTEASDLFRAVVENMNQEMVRGNAACYKEVAGFMESEMKAFVEPKLGLEESV